jgi:acylphosphatase
MQKILYRIYVRGLVQGVGFRWNAATEARLLGITGFVRNMPDGSVYIEAEGSRDKLEKFLKWCRKGPAFSAVESVETESADPVNYSEFRISH